MSYVKMCFCIIIVISIFQHQQLAIPAFEMSWRFAFYPVKKIHQEMV